MPLGNAGRRSNAFERAAAAPRVGLCGHETVPLSRERSPRGRRAGLTPPRVRSRSTDTGVSLLGPTSKKASVTLSAERSWSADVPSGRSRRRRDDGRAPAARRRWMGAEMFSSGDPASDPASASGQPARWSLPCGRTPRSRELSLRAGGRVQLRPSTRRLSSPGRPLTKIACVAA